MSTHHCDYCARSFEPEPGQAPRCPGCLRTRGMRPLAGPGPGRDRRARGARPLTPRPVALMVLLAGAGVGGWAVWSQRGAVEGGIHDVPQATVDGLVEEGRRLLEEGDRKSAYRQGEKAARQAPASAPARELLGDIFMASGAPHEALKEFEAALAIAPRGELHAKLGNLVLALGEPARAQRHLQKAVELEPDAHWAPTVKAALEALSAPPAADTLAPDGVQHQTADL